MSAEFLWDVIAGAVGGAIGAMIGIWLEWLTRPKWMDERGRPAQR